MHGERADSFYRKIGQKLIVAIHFLVETKLRKAVQQDSPRSLIEKYWNCERFT